jgi:FkbM family methyltransferase
MSTQTAFSSSAIDRGTLPSRISWRRRLVRLLDRPGGRFVLGAAATFAARWHLHEDVAVRYIEGLWTRRLGNSFLPDGPRFDYVLPDLAAAKRDLDRLDANAREYWLRYYAPREGDVIFDIGAGRGEDVLTFSHAVGATGRVIAIEADPLSFVFLKNFCRLNGLTNAVALHVATMDKPGHVHVEQSASWTENAVRFDADVVGSGIRADTVDAICAKLGVREIAFLKMNIEGAERHALQGMGAIMPSVRQICVACHDFRAEQGHGEELRTRRFVEGFLRASGFTLFSRPNDSRGYVRDHVFGLRQP